MPEYHGDNLAVGSVVQLTTTVDDPNEWARQQGRKFGSGIVPDPTGLRNLLIALMVARLSAYRVTVPGAVDIIAALNDLIAGVEEMQRQ